MQQTNLDQMVLQINIQKIHVYPNPARDRVRIQGSLVLRTIEIYDVSGRLMISETMDGLNTDINLAQLNAGLYILKCVSIDGTIAGKSFVVTDSQASLINFSHKFSLASESRNFKKPSESSIFVFTTKHFKYGTLQAKQK